MGKLIDLYQTVVKPAIAEKDYAAGIELDVAVCNIKFLPHEQLHEILVTVPSSLGIISAGATLAEMMENGNTSQVERAQAILENKIAFYR